MKKTLFVASLLALSLPQISLAEQQSAIALSAGAFDAFGDESSAELGIEYRFSPLASAFNLIPAIGLAGNSDGGYWGYAGIRYDIELSPAWVLTPNLAVAAYEQGDSVDLGYDIEFRTGIELAYQLSETSRLGLGIYHFSNADIGDENPGTESVLLTYSFSPGF